MLTTPRFVFLCSLLLSLALPRVAPAQGWVSEDWEYRIPVIAKPDRIEGSGTFDDFPLHISLDGPAFTAVFGNAKPDGSDLLVTASDGTTILRREVVGFDPIAQLAEIWVRAETFSKTANLFYLYYGNPAADLPARPIDAWSDDYRVVYHFAQDPGGGWLRDSSPRRADAQLLSIRNWTSSDVMTGPLHQAWNFNGTTHHIATKSISSSDSSFVISAWVENLAPGVNFLMQCNPGFWKVSSQINSTSNRPDLATVDGQVRWFPNPLPFDTGFHHFAFVLDAVADTAIFYFDGVPQPIQSTFPVGLTTLYRKALINPSGNEPVGVFGPMFFNLDDIHFGGGDEFRIRNGVLSPEWIMTEYRNQSDALGFFEFGAPQTANATSVAGLGTTVLGAAQPNPFRASTSVQFTLARRGAVSLAVYDLAGREVARLLDGEMEAGTHETHWSGRSGDGQRVAAGVYFLRLSTQEGTQTRKLSFVR